MADKSKLSVLKAERIWVIAAINGDIERLSDLHDNLVTRIKPIDRVVYTGNYLGHSGDGFGVGRAYFVSPLVFVNSTL